MAPHRRQTTKHRDKRRTHPYSGRSARAKAAERQHQQQQQQQQQQQHIIPSRDRVTTVQLAARQAKFGTLQEPRYEYDTQQSNAPTHYRALALLTHEPSRTTPQNLAHGRLTSASERAAGKIAALWCLKSGEMILPASITPRWFPGDAGYEGVLGRNRINEPDQALLEPEQWTQGLLSALLRLAVRTKGAGDGRIARQELEKEVWARQQGLDDFRYEKLVRECLPMDVKALLGKWGALEKEWDEVEQEMLAELKKGWGPEV